MPKISVIVPIYNVEQYLKRCVDSILNQSFVDFDILLVDDGSTDTSGEICDSFSENDSRVHVIHKNNGGSSEARNVGLDWVMQNSNSEWIAFIDSDDYVHHNYLSSLYSAVKESGHELSVCRYQNNQEDMFIECEKATNYRTVNVEEFYCDDIVNAIVLWGKLFRKVDFINLRFPVGKVIDDEFVTYQILFKKISIALIDEPLYIYCINSESIMHSKWDTRKLEAGEAIKAKLAFFHEKGYNRAYLCEIRYYAMWLCEQIKRSSYSDKYKKINRDLLKQLRFHLRSNKKIADYSFRKDHFIYTYAYPHRMYFFNTAKQLYSRLLNRDKKSE